MDGPARSAPGGRFHPARHGGVGPGDPRFGHRSFHGRKTRPRRRPDRLRHRRASGHCRNRHHLARKRPPARQPVLHHGPAHQFGERLCLVASRTQRAQSLGRHGLFHRCPRYRRCGAAHHARRCGCHGGGRGRSDGVAHRDCRLQRLQGPFHGLERRTRTRLAPIRQTPRRVRDGRGRGRCGARGTGTRQGPGRDDLRGDHRLRPFRAMPIT